MLRGIFYSCDERYKLCLPFSPCLRENRSQLTAYRQDADTKVGGRVIKALAFTKRRSEPGFRERQAKGQSQDRQVRHLGSREIADNENGPAAPQDILSQFPDWHGFDQQPWSPAT